MHVKTLITIPGPVGALHTEVIAPKLPPLGIAIVAHPNPLHGGTNQNKVVQTLAKTFARLGYVSYCPNLRGVGASDGTHDYGMGETEDLLAVAEYARTTHGDLPLVLAGFSFGGFVQARAQAVLQPQQVFLVGPAVGMYAVPAVPAHSVVIHGEKDEVIPLANVLAWAEPQRLPIIVLPGVGHFFHGALGELARLVEAHWRPV